MNRILLRIRLRILEDEVHRIARFHPETKIDIVVDNDEHHFEFFSSRSPPDRVHDASIEACDQKSVPEATMGSRKQRGISNVQKLQKALSEAMKTNRRFRTAEDEQNLLYVRW